MLQGTTGNFVDNRLVIVRNILNMFIPELHKLRLINYLTCSQKAISIIPFENCAPIITSLVSDVSLRSEANARDGRRGASRGRPG